MIFKCSEQLELFIVHVITKTKLTEKLTIFVESNKNNKRNYDKSREYSIYSSFYTQKVGINKKN